VCEKTIVVQNRLEHTINNHDNVVENATTVESRIRDTDMVEEMVNYSKNNILAQAGQSMLAQANRSNQGVLSLLQ
jgi:flagellin